MSILQAAVGAFGLFALLHWLIVPSLRRQLPKGLSPRAVGRVAALLLAEALRSACLVSAATLGLLFAVLGIAPALLVKPSPKDLPDVFTAVHRLHDALEHLATGWSIAFVLLLALALGIAMRREAQLQMKAATDTALSRLKEAASEGDLPKLPDTGEMVARRAGLDRRRSALGTADPTAKPRLVAEMQAIEREVIRLDIVRRLDLAPGLGPLARGRTEGGSWLGSLILSTGLIRSVSAVSRTITILILILLPAALVGCAGEAIAQTAEATEVRLRDLIVANSITAAEETLARALPAAAAEQPLSADDQNLVNQVSQSFARAAAYHIGGFHAFDPGVQRELASLAARQQVLAAYAAEHPGGLAVRGGPDGDATLSEAGRVLATSSPATTAEEQARRTLGEAMRHASPQARAGFRARAAQFLTQAAAPMHPAEIATMLFTESLNILGEVAIGPEAGSSALHQFATKLIPPGGVQERATDLLHLDLTRFLAAVANGALSPDLDHIGPVPVASESATWALRQAGEGADTRLAEAVARWHSAPPTVERTDPLWSGGEAAVGAELLGLAHQPIPSLDVAVPGWRQDLPDAMAQMPDYFPGQLRDETRTPRYRLAQSAPEFRWMAANEAGALRASFARAHSFAALRGFARVGGVLVGSDQDVRDAPALRALAWSEQADGVRLIITRADDGAVLRFGPFRAGILTAALAYAADGRPIAATMPLASIFGRQVMLHPALVDSVLGCEVRHLDQFAEAFTGGLRERRNIEERAEAHKAIYEIGWAVQAQQLLPSVRPGAEGRAAEFLDQIGHLADGILAKKNLPALWQGLRPSAASWSDGRLSPVTKQLEYFEASLVAAIGRCLQSQPEFEEFRGCLAVSSPSPDYVASGRWLAPPPRFRVETGVRERVESVEPDLSFLDIAHSGRTVLWPFDFVVQVTFDSPPYRREPDAGDPPPFEFGRGWANAAVASGLDSPIGRQLEAHRVLADLREFTALQRFFRLAFAGAFGRQFPLSALAQLAAIHPRQAPEPVQTPRWNADEKRNQALREVGMGSTLDALGITRDERLLKNTGDRCPLIGP